MHPLSFAPTGGTQNRETPAGCPFGERVQDIRAKGLPKTATIGCASLLERQDALMVEAVSTEGLLEAWKSCEALLPYAKGKALIRTTREPEWWRQHMSELLEASKAAAILKLNYRPSYLGAAHGPPRTRQQECWPPSETR